ncbi:MAG: tetratricopeptide (TPR) repeat protein [Rhodothermales bacterium]|jgi:tetratricopeptide (TPR) repeat protein
MAKKRRRRESTSKTYHLWAFAIIAILTAVAFAPGLNNGFVYDDVGNFTQNPHYRGLGWANIKWAFTTFYTGPYQPLSWLSLGLDYTIWGMDPFGYHVGNLIFHVANGIVFYLLIHLILTRFGPEERATDIRLACLIGALLFAIHPLRVESVTWATERRDVLSGLFYILCIYAYFQAHAAQADKRMRWFGIAVATFVLSLLSKAWGITLPVVLLILDVYPLRRIDLASWKEKSGVLLEKIPFFAISAIFAVLAIVGQKKYAMGLVSDHSMVDRIMQSFYGLGFYTGKTAVPYPLSPLYQLPLDFNPFQPAYLIPAILVVGATIAMFAKYRRVPALLTGWLIFAVIVSPVLGIVQSGYQIAADRYTYLACLPFPILLSVLLCRLRTPKHWAFGLSAAVVLGFTCLTMAQTKIWKDHGVMWNHVLKVEPWNYQALNGRAAHLDAQGQYDEALADFNRAIELNPVFVTPYTNRAGLFIRRYQEHAAKGDAATAQTQYDRAMADVNAAIELNDRALKAFHYRGFLFQGKSDFAKAEADYSQVISLQPSHQEALHNRGTVRRDLGKLDGAISDLTASLHYNPGNALAHHNRGLVWKMKKQDAQARADFERVLTLRSATPVLKVAAWDEIGKQQMAAGQWAEAAKSFESALALNPGQKKVTERLQLVRQKLK